MVTVSVNVNGRVQGVGFRNYTRRQAEQHGVNGWVQNEADGSVLMVLQGSEADVERVVDAIRTGPRLAEVSSVECSDVDHAETYDGFTVRR